MDGVEHLEHMNSLTQTFSVLADTKHPVDPLALHVLSDLEPEEVEKFQSWWLDVCLSRRVEIMLALQDISEDRPGFIFDQIARIALLTDPSGEVRAEAIPNLRDDPSEGLMNTLVQVMQQDPSHACRAAAARGLGKYVYLHETDDLPLKQGRRVVGALLKVVERDTELLVRCMALESLGFSSCVKVQDIIEDACQDGDEISLCSALRAMGRSYDADQWGNSILEALTHSSAHVLLSAIYASCSLRFSTAVDELLILIYGPSVTSRLRQSKLWTRLVGKKAIGSD